jgi:transposase
MDLAVENQLLREENMFLKMELAKIKKLLYGAKSERFVPTSTGQMTLEFAQEENSSEAKETAPVPTETITFTRRKRKEDAGLPVRSPIPAHIPRQETEILPEGIDLNNAKKIGEAITEYLEYEPGKIYVKQIIRPKYITQDTKIHIADLPSQPIPRSNVGPGLLAHILVSKFVDHLPFHRQRKQMLREGVDVAQSTINDWVRGGCKLIEPLYDLVLSKVQKSGYIMADETPIPVLTEEKKQSTHKGYHWVYFSPVDKLLCFIYHKSRGREAPEQFLENFSGILQTDGYAVYDTFGKRKEITLAGCMAHARRKFKEAFDGGEIRAEEALALFAKLYDIERTAREKSLMAEERLALRQENSVALLNELHQWLKTTLESALPKSRLGQAIAYTLGIWNRLTEYSRNGMLEIDNNWVENKIRPVALGRKNYLFAGSHEGAQRAAMIYTFFAICQLHEVNPQTWLTDVLQRIPDHNIQKLEELLPQNWKAHQMVE